MRCCLRGLLGGALSALCVGTPQGIR